MQSVRDFAVKYLQGSERVVVLCFPGKKNVNDVPRHPADPNTVAAVVPQYSEAFNKSQAWRYTPPKPGPEPRVELPEPKVTTLDNGLKVYVSENHSIPVVALSFTSLAGSSADPKELPGTASFTASMLKQGTAHRTFEQVNNNIGMLGGTLETTVNRDETVIHADGLSTVTDDLISLMADVSLHPSFDSKEVERFRSTRLTTLATQKDRPSDVALVAVNANLYGLDTQYGHPELGTNDSIRDIKRDDLVGFWSSHSVPENSALVFSGDISNSDAVKLANQYFGRWSKKGISSLPPIPPPIPNRKIILIDKPGAPQSEIYVAGLNAPRSSSSYADLEVVNDVLGGAFSSRININFREKHGYTYGAHSLLSYRRGLGFIYVSTSVRSDATAPAIGEIFKELSGIRENPPTAEELTHAKDYMIKGFAGRFATVAGVGNQVGNIFEFGLPISALTEFSLQVKAVSQSGSSEVARRYFDPAHMFVVVVGDKAKIKETLEKLELGEVEEWVLDGRAAIQ